MILGRKRKQSDFRAEVEAHLENEAQRLKDQGLSDEDARMAARRAFGNVTQAEERFYESTRWLWWEHLAQDVRFGLRDIAEGPARGHAGIFLAQALVFQAFDFELKVRIDFRFEVALFAFSPEH